MFFGLLLVVVAAAMLIASTGAIAMLTLAVGKGVPAKYWPAIVLGVCIFPAFCWLGQWHLEALCKANALPVIMEKRSDVEGFYFQVPSQYGFDARPALWGGFSYAELESRSGKHKYIKIVGKHGDESIYSNQRSSAYDFIISPPTMHNPFLSLYRQEMAVVERSTQKVLGKSTDYLWGGPSETFLGGFTSLFFGRSFISCGPGLRKGMANDAVGGQRRQDEYQGRDVQFLTSVLRSGP